MEEVWLGDVYPAEWYDHLEPEIRDVFRHITETTKQDLAIIQAKLEQFGVTVRRPVYTSIDDYIDAQTGHLLKPEICPRDNYVTIGNTLMAPQDIPACWQPTVDMYKHSGQTVLPSSLHRFVNGANVVRAGRDIVIDADIYDPKELDNVPAFNDYRVTWEKNGGHMDGCFAVLKPGLILANHYYNGYDRTFPGWECIFLDQPTYCQHRKTPPRGGEFNGKFYAEGVSMNRAFNDHVIRHAQTWVGDYTETYFELNCLSLNESNVMMLGYNQALENTLKDHGITVHWVPFRCRGFWDGGMHCVTVDIRRQSAIEDYFPGRG